AGIVDIHLHDDVGVAGGAVGGGELHTHPVEARQVERVHTCGVEVAAHTQQCHPPPARWRARAAGGGIGLQGVGLGYGIVGFGGAGQVVGGRVVVPGQHNSAAVGGRHARQVVGQPDRRAGGGDVVGAPQGGVVGVVGACGVVGVGGVGVGGGVARDHWQ